MGWAGMNKRSAIGLDLGRRTLSAVQLSRHRDAWRVEAAASIQRAEPQTPIGEEDLDRLSGVIDRLGFTGSDVVVAAPATMLVTSVLTLPPEGRPEDREQLIKDEFARSSSYDPDASELAWWELPASARGGSATEVMAVACEHQDADALVDLAEGTGLNVVALDVEPAAIARWISLIPDRAATLAAVVAIGWESSLLVAVHGDRLVYERHLPEAGLQKVYEAMQARLGLSSDVAGVVLREHGLRSRRREGDAVEMPAEVSVAIAGHLETMIGELTVAFAYLSHRYPHDPVGEVYLIGEGASIAGLDEFLSERIEPQVRKADSGNLEDCTGSPEAISMSEMAVAIGLALHAGE